MAELRHRQPQSVDSLLQEQFLAAEEQEEVILQLKTCYDRQSQVWAAVFATLAGLLAGGCFCLALHQLVDPLGLRHHAFFYHTVNKYGVAAGEACNGVSLALSAGFLVSHAYEASKSQLRAWQKPLFYASLLSATAAAIFWLVSCLRAARYQEESLSDLWRYAWLPLAPVGYMSLTWYLVSSFGRTHKDIAALRGSMYNLHSA